MALSVSSIASSSCRNFPATNTMAAVGLRSDLPKIHTPISLCKTNPTFRVSFLPIRVTRKLPRKSLQVRSVAAPSEAVSGFDDMVSGTTRKYYMLGGKGGVGKTSCAASLAVKFANNGHPTLVVSTDPAHSLSDSFAQDLTGGMLVPVEGPDSPLFALEINPEKAREEFRNASQKNGGTGVKDFMDGMGLGMLVEQLGELKLGELLDTPPPGLDEAIAISKASIVHLAFVISLVVLHLIVFWICLASSLMTKHVSRLCNFLSHKNIVYLLESFLILHPRVIHCGFCPYQISWMHLLARF
ncbi:hypothetical protein PVL29_016890 [Vitis rotundifolia]|uniref:ArsA/GET3 Anion-transporting ATPase-like domain-containing protein n=1 Tax=Vitis rotundifolia TaxID=103349 RepID=A0AA39DIB0_VITRO|nr:hypothetical protein PVL29_016890 [Vitis rotundifolia]